MEQLNLPSFEANVKKINGIVKIMDVLRRAFVALTPEEYVRQHFIHYLIDHKGYSPTLMANEVAVTLNGMTRRCDTVLYGQDMTPRMIIEYKATSVKIDQKVFNQICRYNMVLKVEYLIVSNGINHYCFKMNYETGNYEYLPYIPDYKNL